RGVAKGCRGAWHDAETGAVLRRVPLPVGKDPSYAVREAAVSPDGKYFAVAGSAGAQIWEVTTARPVSPFLKNRERQSTIAVAFSPDGRTLLTGSTDRHPRRRSVP